MPVNGYQLKRSLNDLERRRTLLQSQWDECLWVYESATDAADPEAVLAELVAIERRIAALQAAQTAYNLAVTATIRTAGGATEAVSLAEAVKRVGGVGRISALLQKAVKSDQGYNMYGAHSRSLEQEHATRQISFERLGELVREYGNLADALRQAIAVANDQPAELPGLDPSLLE